MEKKKRNDGGNVLSAGGVGDINILMTMDSLMSFSMGMKVPKEKKQPVRLTPSKKLQKESTVPIVLETYGTLKTENRTTGFGQYDPKTNNPNKITEQ